jgi:NAD(P)-dependent dehydrogenase (short-subunit alcohol dehydrogenase family)
MEWSTDPDALRGRTAVVAGATRGAGRGIAAALGEAGATVVCTGRSSATGAASLDYERPETIEETADQRWTRRLEHPDLAARPQRGVAHPSPRGRDPPGHVAPPSPRFVGRAVAALAADHDRADWNQQSASSAELAGPYGFTDIDGTQPLGVSCGGHHHQSTIDDGASLGELAMTE